MKIDQNKTNTRSKLRWGIAGIFGLLTVALVFDLPRQFNFGVNWINDKIGIGFPTVPEKPFRLGLDLKGGVQLIYQADVSLVDAPKQAAAVEGVRDVIERRVNGMGVGEPSVTNSHIDQYYRINVELPGVTDINQAIKMIGETPILEFKEQNTEPARGLTAEETKELNTFNETAKKKADSLLAQLKKNGNFEELAKQNSEDEAGKNNGGYMNFVTAQSPYSEIYEWATKAKPNEISKSAVKSEEGFNVLKRGSEKDGAVEVRASHILICYLGAKNCEAKVTKNEALKKAEEIYAKANANNFSDLAKENSTDLSNKEVGGDLGFFTKETMVSEFSTAVFSAKKGDIIGPVETQFGYHIIYKKDERITKQYEVWRILAKTKSAADILPPQTDWKSTGLSGKQLERSEVVSDQTTGEVQVSLKFNTEGAKLFKEITERNIGQPVAIFLDGVPISTPRVNTAITDGSAVITGNFNLVEAKLLSQRLNAGALPVPVELVSQQSIGATLGLDSLKTSLMAGVVGAILVMIFMIIFYRLPGVVAVFALFLYIALTLALFKLLGFTITLSGIAGFIMSLGVAVDANILIFERMKEELKRGKSLKTAVEEGFLRAWTSIRDGNASTLITCLILINFGTSFVKGFAVTLALGILVSLFTAMTITRIILRFIVPWVKDGNAGWLFLGRKNEEAENTKI
ncbi:MAG: protein translocase subunit SecD [Patescibacteria group bacterium]